MGSRDCRAIAPAFLWLSLTACGPIEYVNQVTRRAESSVAAARAVDAPKYAPYWWMRATEYLHQARVEAAAADFQAANRFGRLATEAADKAHDEALLRARDPEARKELEAIDGRGLAPAIEADTSDADDAAGDAGAPLDAAARPAPGSGDAP